MAMSPREHRWIYVVGPLDAAQAAVAVTQLTHGPPKHDEREGAEGDKNR